MKTLRPQKRPKANWTRAFPRQVQKAREPQPKPRSQRDRDGDRYRRQARAAVATARAAGLRCPVSGELVDQVHHKYGRRGRLLLWRPGWVLVSGDGHRWIEQNMDTARTLGLLGRIGTYNDYERAAADAAKDF